MAATMNANTSTEASTMAAPPKFSRYRSVRQAATKTVANGGVTASIPSGSNASSEPEAATQWQNESIARSMSRYRRPKTATAAAPPLVPALPPLPSPSVVSRTISPTSPRANAAPKKTGRILLQGSRDPAPGEARPMTTGNGSVPEQDDEDEVSDGEKARRRDEAMRQLTMAAHPNRAARAPEKSHRTKPDNHHRTVEKKRDEKHSSQGSNDQKRSSWKEKLGMARHKASGPSTPVQDNQADVPKSRNIEPGGGGIVPGIDAPVSAVNAGERRVSVRCGSTSINLPVTPTTRVKDLIYSAANCFSEPVDPKNTILLESFLQLGLERPLRRYEHVRDVMNSWATDSANSLIITPFPHEGAKEKLEFKRAPSVQPKDAKFYLYHSQKPGKWDKRYITLRTDGQVVVSKKADAKESKDFSNICHISDFDIYTPTSRQLSKKLKPPKKICFAIKSQQKSSMFLSTENFVHFFATSDENIAQNFYDVIHNWRSWYLVHVLGVGQKKLDDLPVKPGSAAVGHSPPHHQRGISTESTPYELGSFKHLAEFGQNAEPEPTPRSKQAPENSASNTREMYHRKKHARDYAPPPSSFPVALGLDTRSGYAESISSPQDDDSATFSPTGLLGSAYSQRRAAQAEREAKEAREDPNDPFISHGLLSKLSPTTSTPSSRNHVFSNPSSHQNSRSNTLHSQYHAEGSIHSRSNSVRQRSKPLVDLTPVYREPPQHARKGYGVKIESGVPLVEAATGLEVAPGMIHVPPSTAWRRPETGGPITAHDSTAASIAPRRRANTIRSQHHSPHSLSPTSPDNPFMPSSLLALSADQGKNSHTNQGIGRGVATGDRYAARPLLDLTPASEFAEGSLLRSVEKGS